MLKRLDAMTEKQRLRFEEINQANTMTAKAWTMRENFLEIYESESEDQAIVFFERWYKNVIHSNVKHLKKAAKTIRRYWPNILTQIGRQISNARAEQTNSKIAKLQRMANGYSNFANLRAAILFFNGKLDLLSHN